LLEQLRTIRSSAVKEVRGRGSWIGIELHKQASLYGEALKEQGICKETHERVIRIALPLVITREEIDRALDRIRKVPI
jgi:ornithine--oxo-acid transaminase